MRLIVLVFLFSAVPLSAQHPEYYRILAGERLALQCRLDLIRQARTELRVSTYAIDPDVVGLATLSLLVDAAARGVRVQLLIDDFGSHLDPCLLQYLGERGVAVRVFHKVKWWRPGKTPQRMHGKMLIADRRRLIVGGRNLKDEYYTLDTVANFLDREVLAVSDSVAQHAAAHFAVMWNDRRLSTRQGKPLTDAERGCWQRALAASPDSLRRRLALQPFGERDWTAGLRPTAGRVQFIHDNFVRSPATGPRKDRGSTRALIALVDRAERTVDIENSYFLPPKPWRRAFRDAIRRGVTVRVLTNSSYTTDVPLVQAVYRLRRARYERMGIELWEYRGKKMLHTKAMVIDDRRSVIGSYNLDRQSYRNNTEVAVWVDDPAAVADHRRILEHVRGQSVQAGEAPPAGLPQPTRVQRKRHRWGQVLWWTVAPVVGWVF